MTDEEAKTSNEQAGPTRPSAEAWREVGQQFEALGESLAAAFRTAWENAENRQQRREVQASLENIAENISQAIKEATTSPEAGQMREEVEKIAQSAQTAGRQTLEETRPHLLSALHELRAAVDKMISRLETQESTAPAGPTGETPSEEPESTG